MIAPGTHARLFLNDKLVGTIRLQRATQSWHHGQFEPNPAFSQFAPLFGRWSLLMHAEDDQDRQSPEVLDELRKLEYEIDSLRARVHFPDNDQWRNAIQLNIDGPLIEWKEF